jgi:DNA-binding XRE family transcriptional regulator
MCQFEAARIIGVTEGPICNSENNRSYPKGVFFPKIIYFLGYNPMKHTKETLFEQIICYRRGNGLSQNKLIKILKTYLSTLRRWEKKKSKT